MGKRKEPKQLLKLMTYALGRRPDEFGLAPDADGFIRIKDVIRALCEEPGWGYVRRSHLNEVLITFREHPFVLDDDRIRVTDPHRSARPVADVIPPKLLYHCVRRKAYPVVLRKGIMPMGQPRVRLATTEALAMRMGRRRDPKPVLLTVQARRAGEAGVPFQRQGEFLYLVDHVPVGYFTGPPLPKTAQAQAAPQKTPVCAPEPRPGSFVLDLERSERLQRQQIKKKGLKKDVAWKKEARKFRRTKRDR